MSVGSLVGSVWRKRGGLVFTVDVDRGVDLVGKDGNGKVRSVERRELLKEWVSWDGLDLQGVLVLVPRYKRWASESIGSYVRWKVEGKAHRVATSEKPVVEGQAIEDIFSEARHMGVDLDYLKYLLVNACLSEFCAKHPWYESFADLVVWKHYYGRQVGKFTIPVGYVRVKRALLSLGSSAVSMAELALVDFEKFVAQEIVRREIAEMAALVAEMAEKSA